MATFPALIPSSRTFTPGEYPHSPFAGWSGQENRTRHSNVMVSSLLRVSFIGLTHDQVSDVIDHYNGQVGSYVIFDLPAAIWSGVSDPSDYTLSGYFWRYASPPSIEDLLCGKHNLSIELESVTPQSNTAAGRTWNVSINWSPGIASGLAAGSADALGVEWFAIIQWEEINPDAETPGSNLSATATWTPGAALEAADVFNAVLYTGNGSTQSITGVGFEPGLVWTKRRTVSTGAHAFYDYARGATKYWQSSTTAQQVTNANSLTAFDNDGFTLGNAAISNTSSASYVAWCLAKGSTGASNANGSITTTVYANAAAGFNIATYTGTGANATIGHGLGAEPELVIVRNLNITAQHVVIGNFLGANEYLLGVGTGGVQTSSTIVQGYSSNTISLGSASSVNGSGNDLIAYAFKSIVGTSKVGTYTGTGAADQTIATGFPPQFVLIKSYSATGDWMLFDNARGVGNQMLMHSPNPETTVDKIAFVSTGFTVKASENTNTSSVSYVYLAFR